MKTVGRHAQARPRPVPRAGGVRHVRLRARQGVARPSSTAATASPSCSSRASTRRMPVEEQVVVDLRRHPAATSTTSRSPTSGASRPSCSTTCRPATATSSRHPHDRGHPTTRTSLEATTRRRPSPTEFAPSERPTTRRGLGSTDGWWPGTHPPPADQDGPVDEEDHHAHGAHRRQPHRQGPAARAAARPYSEQITEVIRNLAEAGAGRATRCSGRASEISKVGFVVITADRGLAGATTRRSSAPPSGRCAAEQAEGRETTLVHGRQEGADATSASAATGSTQSSWRHRPAHLRGRPRGRRVVAERVRGRASSTGSTLVYTRFLSRRHPAGGRRAGSCRWSSRPSTSDGRADGPPADFEFEPPPTRSSTAAAPLRRGPALRRPARRRRPPSTPPASGP